MKRGTFYASCSSKQSWYCQLPRSDKESVLIPWREGHLAFVCWKLQTNTVFPSHVCGRIDLDASNIDRKIRRFMADAATYAYVSMQQRL